MRRPELPILTALRFPAAAAIVLFHYLFQIDWPISVYNGLTSGVSFFYVLSGFILYYNYVDRTGRDDFWMARFARIWPIHFVTFLMALALIPFARLLGTAHWYITMPANLLLVQAWLPFHGSALSYNGVAWSLSAEAFFYLCFPWLLAAMKKHGVVPLLAGTFVLGLILVLTVNYFLPAEPEFGSFSPGARLFEFVLGMATCHLWFRESRQAGRTEGWSLYEAATLLAVLILMLVAGPFLKDQTTAYPICDWLVTSVSAIGLAGLVWVFAHQAGAISHAFSSRFFVRLGEVSFAVYMCHQILLRWLFAQSFTVTWPAWSLLVVYLLSTLALSFALFYWVETPARHLIMGAYKGRRNPVAQPVK